MFLYEEDNVVTPSIKKKAVIKMEGLILMRDKVIGIKMMEKVLWFMWRVGYDI